MAGSILGSSETSLVYWVDLTLSDTVSFRAALSSHDIVWGADDNGEPLIYTADGTFLGIGTSVYELSTTNQPLEVTVELSPQEMLFVNTRSYLRRQARVWRANLTADNRLENIQQIKNGFLDSHADAPGMSITFTISSWLSIAQGNTSTPGGLDFASQVVRNFSLDRTTNATASPEFTDVGAAVFASNNNTLSVGSVLPFLANPVEDVSTGRSDTDFFIPAGNTSSQVPRSGQPYPIDSTFRSTSDNNYQFFRGGPRRNYLDFSRDEVVGRVDMDPSFGDSIALPFSLVTEGFVIRAENLSEAESRRFQAGDGSVADNPNSSAQQRIPTSAITNIIGGVGTTTSSSIRTRTAAILPPNRLCNPDGITNDAPSIQLLTHGYSRDFDLEGVGQGSTSSGRVRLSSFGYDRLSQDRATVADNNVNPNQIIRLDQALCLGPVNEISITSPLFSNNHNKFTYSSAANAGMRTGVDIRQQGNPTTGGTIADPFSNYPDDLRITFNRTAGAITSATIQVTNTTTETIQPNSDGSFTIPVYASVFNSYYVAVAAFPTTGPGANSPSTQDGTDRSTPLYFWTCVQDSNRNLGTNTVYPAQAVPQLTSGTRGTAIHFNGTTGQKTRRNKVMEVQIFPGEADAGKVCWARWTIYNRAFEAAGITTNDNYDPAGGSNAFQRGTNHTINFIGNPFGEGNNDALFSFKYTITGLSNPRDIIRDIVANQVGIGTDLLDTDANSDAETGTFRTPDSINSLNRSALFADSRFPDRGTAEEARVNNINIVPNILSGTLPADSYSQMLETIFENTGLLPVEDKTPLTTAADPETPIYMFSGVGRNSNDTNQGFAQDFNDNNSSFQIEFGRSSDIYNAFTGTIRGIQSESGVADIAVNLGSSMESLPLVQNDNGFINSINPAMDLLQVNIVVDANGDRSILTSGNGVLPADTIADRIAYLIISRRLGLDTLTINTDYKHAGNLRLGQFVRVEWSKFNWVGNATTSWRIIRIEDDNAGRISLQCQRHDNLVSAGSEYNTFTFNLRAGSESAATVGGSSSTTAASRVIDGARTTSTALDTDRTVTFNNNVNVGGNLNAPRSGNHNVDFGSL